MQVYTDFYVNSWIRLIIVAFFLFFKTLSKRLVVLPNQKEILILIYGSDHLLSIIK